MKKVVVILGFVFSVVLFTSCTDNTEDNIRANEIQSGVDVNKDEIENPRDKGQG